MSYTGYTFCTITHDTISAQEGAAYGFLPLLNRRNCMLFLIYLDNKLRYEIVTIMDAMGAETDSATSRVLI